MSAKDLYWLRKVAGNCVRCGEPAQNDTVMCATHSVYTRENSRKTYRRRKARRAA